MIVYDFLCSFRNILCGKKSNVALSLRNPSWEALECGWHDEGRKLKCHCFGSLANPDGLTPQWVPVINQILLTVSIVLAYMGGVIPYKTTLFSSQKDKIEREITVEESTPSGR